MKREGLLLILALSAVIIAAEQATEKTPEKPSTPPPPKWTSPDLWRDGLREGLSESHAVKTLGKPCCRLVQHDYIYLCYQELPKLDGGEIKLPSAGFVKVSKKTENKNPGPQRPKYRVKEWTEPNWDRLKSSPPPPETPQKLRPKRRLEDWEKEKNWQRLLVNMPKAAAKKILGSPRREESQLSKSGFRSSYDTIWYYGSIPDCAEVRFKDDLITEWAEPFWPQIEKTCFEPVPPPDEKQPAQ